MSNLILLYISLVCITLSCLSVMYNTYIHTVMDLEEIKRDAVIRIRKYRPIEKLLEICALLVLFLLVIDIIQVTMNPNTPIVGVNGVITALLVNPLILKYYRYRRNVVYKPSLARLFSIQFDMIYIGFILLYIRFTTTKMK